MENRKKPITPEPLTPEELAEDALQNAYNSFQSGLMNKSLQNILVYKGLTNKDSIDLMILQLVIYAELPWNQEFNNTKRALLKEINIEDLFQRIKDLKDKYPSDNVRRAVGKALIKIMM